MNKSSKNTEIDIMGTALLEYQQGQDFENIRTWTSVAGEDELAPAYLFRTYEQMPEIEKKALNLSRGEVLDIGSGSGAHALWLQERDFSVKAIDISKGNIKVCCLRGVHRAEVQDIWELKNEHYDTLLLLMNGMGMCGRLNRLTDLLIHLKTLLKPGGQILADSSDIIYMFENEEGEIDLPEDHYYGEVTFQTFYKKLEGARFPWLYVDFFNLKLHARAAGLRCELILKGEHFDYLACLTFD